MWNLLSIRECFIGIIESSSSRHYLDGRIFILQHPPHPFLPYPFVTSDFWIYKILPNRSIFLSFMIQDKFGHCSSLKGRYSMASSSNELDFIELKWCPSTTIFSSTLLHKLQYHSFLNLFQDAFLISPKFLILFLPSLTLPYLHLLFPV